MSRLSSLAPVMSLLALASFGLTGCTLNSNPNAPNTVDVHIQGMVHGGQQPVSGSTVQLWAMGTTGYGSAATPLLTSTVTSGPDGTFSITGKYTCPTNAVVYITATGGNAGGGTNPSIAMMDAFDYCFYLNSSSYLFINEVTTAASAAALAQFAVDGAHIGSASSSASENGIAYATEASNLLVSKTTGAAALTTYDGNGIAPQAKLNSLANSIASCINSASPFSACTTLFNDAPSTTGSIPTDTNAAAINIAQNPGANVTAIFNLASGTAPFFPALPTAPPDWVMAVKHINKSQTTAASEYTDIAFDAAGDPTLVDYGAKKLVGLFGRGDFISASSTTYLPRTIAFDTVGAGHTWVAATQNSISGSAIKSTATLTGIAVDLSGNVWASASDGTVTKMVPSGTGPTATLSEATGSPFTVTSGAALSSIAVDPSGNIWFSSSSSPALYEINSSGVSLSTTSGFSPAGLQASNNLSFDSSANIWSGSTAISSTTDAGAFDTSGTTGGGLGTSLGVQVDGLGNIWSFSTSGVLSGFKPSGTPLSPSTGFLSDYGLTTTEGTLRIDGSGNIWKTFGPVGVNAGVIQVLGIAAPVVMPAYLQAKNNTYGTRP